MSLRGPARSTPQWRSPLAGSCQYLPVLADTCRLLPVLASTCRLLPVLANTCQFCQGVNFLSLCFVMACCSATSDNTNPAIEPRLSLLSSLDKYRFRVAWPLAAMRFGRYRPLSPRRGSGLGGPSSSGALRPRLNASVPSALSVFTFQIALLSAFGDHAFDKLGAGPSRSSGE